MQPTFRAVRNRGGHDTVCRCPESRGTLAEEFFRPSTSFRRLNNEEGDLDPPCLVLLGGFVALESQEKQADPLKKLRARSEAKCSASVRAAK